MLVTDSGFAEEIALEAGRICQEVLPRLLASRVAEEKFGDTGRETDEWLVFGAIERIGLSAEDFLQAGPDPEGGLDGDDFKSLLQRVSQRDLDQASEQRYLAFVAGANQDLDEVPAHGVVELGVDSERNVRFVGLAFHGDGHGRDSFSAALEEALHDDDKYGDGLKVARILDVPEVYLSFVYIEGLEEDDYRVYEIDKCCYGSRRPRMVNLEAARESVLRVLNLRWASGEGNDQNDQSEKANSE